MFECTLALPDDVSDHVPVGPKDVLGSTPVVLDDSNVAASQDVSNTTADADEISAVWLLQGVSLLLLILVIGGSRTACSGTGSKRSIWRYGCMWVLKEWRSLAPLLLRARGLTWQHSRRCKASRQRLRLWLSEEPEGLRVRDKEGSEEGHVDGPDEAHVEGPEEGHVEGSEEGHVEGTDEAHVEGSVEGHVEGPDEAHVEGSEEAQVEGSESRSRDSKSRASREGVSGDSVPLPRVSSGDPVSPVPTVLRARARAQVDEDSERLSRSVSIEESGEDGDGLCSRRWRWLSNDERGDFERDWLQRVPASDLTDAGGRDGVTLEPGDVGTDNDASALGEVA